MDASVAAGKTFTAAAANHSDVARDLTLFRVGTRRQLLVDNIRSGCKPTCHKALVSLLGDASGLFRSRWT